MVDDTCLSPEDLERARLIPNAVFSSPREVLESPRLTRTQKVDILRRWAYEAAELSVAVEEGMPDGDDDLQRQIQLALEALQEGLGVERSGPTKHHGLPD